MIKNYKYTYWVIDGSVVFGSNFRTMKRAAQFLLHIKANGFGYLKPESINPEIERVKMFTPGNSMQFNVKRNGKWVDWWDGLYGKFKNEQRDEIKDDYKKEDKLP